MPLGTIVKGIGGFYYVKTSDEIYECKARGIFRKEDITPLTGDRVEITVTDEEKKTGSLDRIEPRSSQLIRPAVANVDQIAIVVAAKSPVPDFMLLDKLLITAEMKNVAPFICINKTDLDEKEEYRVLERSYSLAGYPILALSMLANSGYDILSAQLKDKITVFAGQSGVGKSTILNKVLDSLVMKTGAISQKVERGKHTTRHAELLELNEGGFVVDTPGFSSFELAELECSQLELYYPEFTKHLGKCKFTGCSHISEPGCEVKEALENGCISKGRYQRYCDLYNLLKSSHKEYGRTKKRQ